jgi:hypothetical protein
MNLGKTVFAQLMDFVPAHEFRRWVERYSGNCKTSSFSYWDQFLCIAFAQLAYRESLRDIQTCLRVVGGAAVSSGHSRARRAQHSGRCQREPRLAYLCRLGSSLDSQRSPVICQRRFRSRTGTNGLCFGLHHHRSLPFVVSVGSLLGRKRGGEDAHSARSARQRTGLHLQMVLASRSIGQSCCTMQCSEVMRCSGAL